MPRRQFMADVQSAQTEILPPGIVGLQQGEDDGQIIVDFVADSASQLASPIQITALIPDLSEYPSTHQYMLFCSDNAPRRVASALETLKGASRRTISQLLDIISSVVAATPSGQAAEAAIEVDSDEGVDEDEENASDIYDSDHEAFTFGAQTHFKSPIQQGPGASTGQSTSPKFRSRVRADLLAAKDAGFKIGHLGHLINGHHAFVTVSVRIAKLGISEEAMQAWQLVGTDYLVLIIQYPNGYKTCDDLLGCENRHILSNVGMRVRVGKTYKPMLQGAIDAFATARAQGRESSFSEEDAGATATANDSVFHDTFISGPLVELLQERLVPILRYRQTGVDWRGAEQMFDHVLQQGATSVEASCNDYGQPEAIKPSLPALVTADHFVSDATGQLSFPLLAMQFLLRHFVRCTEFCLVCHRQLDSDVEAIKPYVCDAPLCLYQYMTLGLGPSIEHEILAQPYVVDLLISFCYCSAAQKKLKDFPDGLALMVPYVDQTKYLVGVTASRYAVYNPVAPMPKDVPPTTAPTAPTYDVGVDLERLEIIFWTHQTPCPVVRGAWIVLTTTAAGQGIEYHCRIVDTALYPTVTIGSPVAVEDMQNNRQEVGHRGSLSSTPNTTGLKSITPATTPKWCAATFRIYNQDFDALPPDSKSLAICKLLDTVPDMKLMQSWLLAKRPAELKQWSDRMSPAALSLLRWIIASNRACIMQVDGDPQTAASGNLQSRVQGMAEFVQFRFAMGAPDKEQRFVNAVRSTTQRLRLQYPTMFAWHGSPLHNWHMIIREGLHFKNTDHGRAYGHGVYHAKDAQTSMGYAAMGGYPGVHGLGGTNSTSIPRGQWPGSILRIDTALALNEIVNAPAEFISSSPYYVVAKLEWIQTRFLFVHTNTQTDNAKLPASTRLVHPHKQDPMRTPTGTRGEVIQIPAAAIKSGRLQKHSTEPSSGQGAAKKIKSEKGGFQNPVLVDCSPDRDDDEESVSTEAEDLDVLFAEDTDLEGGRIANDENTLPADVVKVKGAPTDFQPGSLDFSTLPLMPVPSYAVSGTTRSLMKELQKLRKTQDSHALTDLGWYIDSEKIDNAYQWIVELHSFHVIDTKLPLVADMKKYKVTSIVLEVRFNKDFPFTPPYVRVVRPRFLSRLQGGGGHIVMGGAMCMELLTNTGWSSASSMESVLMQIRLAIASDPPARLDPSSGSSKRNDYGTAEAAEGYIRACQTHGWQVPPGFKEMAYGTTGTLAGGMFSI